jgi:hypothetical protein
LIVASLTLIHFLFICIILAASGWIISILGGGAGGLFVGSNVTLGSGSVYTGCSFSTGILNVALGSGSVCAGCSS